jgi:hypothetical protein
VKTSQICVSLSEADAQNLEYGENVTSPTDSESGRGTCASTDLSSCPTELDGFIRGPRSYETSVDRQSNTMHRTAGVTVSVAILAVDRNVRLPKLENFATAAPSP